MGIKSATSHAKRVSSLHAISAKSKKIKLKKYSLLGQFLDKLFVLVKLLQGFGVHARHAQVLSLITVLLVSEDTHLHLRARDVLEPVE